jgi:hypothetical protein
MTMDSIKMIAPDTQEEIEVYVLEETTLNQQRYLLVTDEESEDTDAEAFILKEVEDHDTDATYEVVEDDIELEAVVKIFQELVENSTLEL